MTREEIRIKMEGRRLAAEFFDIPVSLILRAERIKKADESLFAQVGDGTLTLDEAEARLAGRK